MEPATAPPARPVAVIETDLFCEACGFNLYTQRVTRDERLGLLVVQCPECGAHQSAHLRVTAGQKWLQRLGLLGLLMWLGVVVGLLIGTFFFFVGVQSAAREGLTRVAFETLDGRALRAEWSPVTLGASRFQFRLDADSAVLVDSKEVREVRKWAHWVDRLLGRPGSGTDTTPLGSPDMSLSGTATIVAVFATVGYVFGVVFAAVVWFWPARTRWLMLAVPVLATAAIMAIGGVSNVGAWYGVNNPPDLSLLRLVDLGVGLLTLALFALALATGRKLARLLVLLFLPPGTRPALAFLWHCDGLEFPRREAPIN